MHFIVVLPLLLFTMIACDRSDGISLKTVLPVSSELSIER